MMLKVGKLYICEEYFLMFYPDPETAAGGAPFTAPRAMPVHRTSAPAARNDASYWSEQFGKPVSYAEKNIPLLVLNNKVNFYEVLVGNRKGWIIYKDFLNIKEIDNV